MSNQQTFGQSSVVPPPPIVATSYVTNVGTAIPAANVLNVLGAGSISTSGSGNTVTAQLTGLTNHALQVGAGTATLTQLSIGSTGQVLQANSAADPSWSTATYPSTTTINQILYSSAANVVSGLATANNGVLITSATGVPSLLPNGTTGQVLTATTGSPPSWAAITTPPTVATSYVTDSGTATPAANVLNVVGSTTTNNNTNGIQTLGSGNTVTAQLTNRIVGTGTTTDGVTPVLLYSFNLGATPGSYTFFSRIAAYDLTDSLGASYAGFSGVRTTGASATLLGSNVSLSNEEGLLVGVDLESSVSGNSYSLTATGVAGKTIHFVAITEYVLAV